MNNTTLFKNLLVALLSLSVVGLAVAMPAVGLAGDKEGAREALLERRGPPMRGVPGGPTGESPHYLQRLLNRLDLDDSQQEAVRAILESGRESGNPLRENVRESLNALRELYQDESTGNRELEAAIESFMASKEDLREHRVNLKEQIREVLNERQQAQLILMAEQRARRGFRGGMKGHQGRRGPGHR